MAELKHFRNPEFSLWQSAVDEVVARGKAGGGAPAAGAGATLSRPEATDAMVQAATLDLTAAQLGAPPPAPPTADAKPAGGSTIPYCSTLARKVAVAVLEGNHDDEARYRSELGAFGVCDPRWIEAVQKYIDFQVSNGKVPYRVYQHIDDFVIDDRKILPDRARVAIVGDWGTGQEEARQVLAQIARKKPDVAIHLGDIYYSGTQFEVDNYFTQIWDALLPGVPSYTLSGNHDMFGGGQPYYNLVDKLGQPASYFCLRNTAWQFIAVDTGLHDRKPSGSEPTYLEETEVDWVMDKIATAGGRQTILLSHHQLFSAIEDIVPGQSMAVNSVLQRQLSPIFPTLTAWLWGHEHNLVIYEPYLGVLGRCIGHGAVPVGIDENLAVKHAEVPMKDLRLDKGEAFYVHGYAILDLDGPAATLGYYQDTDESTPQFIEFFGAARAQVP